MAKRRTTGRKGTKKKYHFEMTSFSIFVWTFCLFFLLTWIFVLGILVGRGFFPGAVTAISDIRGQIGKIRAVVGKNQESETLKKLPPHPKLVFYDQLSKKKDEAQNEGRHDKKSRVSRGPVEAKAPKPTAPAPKPVADQKKASNGVMHKGTEAPSGQARYTIQLASLELASQAEKMSNRLVGRGFPAYYYDVKVKGKTYYRVRCGRFATKKEAEAFAKRLKKEAGVKGFVTRLQ